MMGPELIFVSLAILLVLVVASVPIGIALGVASVIGAYLAYGDIDIALSILGSTAYDAIRNQALAVIQITVCQVDAQALLTYQPAATQGHGREREVHITLGRYLAGVTGV